MRVKQGTTIQIARGVTALAYRGSDGTLVVEIEGADVVHGENAGGPRMRIYLNDAPVYENPAHPGEWE